MPKKFLKYKLVVFFYFSKNAFGELQNNSNSIVDHGSIRSDVVRTAAGQTGASAALATFPWQPRRGPVPRGRDRHHDASRHLQSSTRRGQTPQRDDFSRFPRARQRDNVHGHDRVVRVDDEPQRQWQQHQ